MKRGVSQTDFHDLMQKTIESDGVIVLFNTALDILDLSKLDTESFDMLTATNVHIRKLKLPERQVEAEITIAKSRIGSLHGSDRTYNSQLNVSECEIEQCLFRSATFTDQVRFLGCEISKAADFGSAVFEDILLFSTPEDEIQDDIGFDSDLTSAAEATEFRCTANFSRTTYHDFGRFAGCRFELGAHFDDIQADTTLTFSGAHFHHFANFRMSEFNRAIDFTETRFGYATFEECHFHGPLNFSNATFRGSELEHITLARGLGGHLSVEGISSPATEKIATRTTNLQLLNSPVGTDWDLNMNECRVDEELLLKSVSYETSICLQHAEFGELHLRALASGSGTIALDESTITSGDIRFFGDTNPDITAEYATIGDISFYGVEGVNPFKNLHFKNTEFDGFEFSSHRMFFEDLDWDLMETSRGWSYSARDCEQQFVNARVAARQTGDDYAAGQFFIKEKQSRRRRHLNGVNEGNGISRIQDGYNWLSNLALDLVCKYGESSRRLLGMGAFTILAYASVYSWIDAPLNYSFEQPVTVPVGDFTVDAVFIDTLAYLVFSVEVFTTFVLTSPSVNNPAVRVATASEGLAGALFVALLVFTLTKSLHR